MLRNQNPSEVIRSMSLVLKELPGTLLITLVAFASVPILSALFFADLHGPFFLKLLLIYSYYIGPLIICYTILNRSFIFLGMIFSEYVAVIATVFWAVETLNPWVLPVTYMALGATGILALILFNRDTMLPFMSNSLEKRFWRKAARFQLRYKITVHDQGQEEIANQRFSVFLENCSISGLGIRATPQYLPKFLAEKQAGDEVTFTAQFSNHEVMTFNASLIWHTHTASICRAGFKGQDYKTMCKLLTRVDAESPKICLRTLAAKLWISSRMRRGAMALWALSLGSALLIPACNLNQKNITAESARQVND